jgi:polysaccharide biosynthesis protein PslH
MRILQITNRIPYPPVSGAPLHTYQILKRVATKHEVWLATFVETAEQRQSGEHLKSICAEVITIPVGANGAFVRPFQGIHYLLDGIPPDLRLNYSKALFLQVKELSTRIKFDLVQIEHSEMGLYLKALPPELAKYSIWCLHDLDWIKFHRIAGLESRFVRKLRLSVHSYMLRKWIPNYAERFNIITTVTQKEKYLLQKANHRLNVEVIPGGVDTREFTPLPRHNVTPALVFVGNMGYLPNADGMINFCSDTLPLIRRQVPEIEMWIVGINPSPKVLSLQAQGVHVTGRVDDVRPYYERSAVCVIPLRAGGGGRLKIMESMALGRPVVSTSVGCEGKEYEDGVHLLIADTPDEFAEKTVHLLTNPDLVNRISDNARKLVVDRYDWDVITQQLLQIYSGIA